ncbi:MAG: UvrD-helicase domain-containing protein, partial [Akkermansia sp.]
MLISASAGTGKTYQLSLRFLGLLALNGGNHPERLIAITFTRK